jgi:hypothetical protein
MTRFLLRSRRLMAVSILVLLAGVFALSVATRKPCLRARTAPWHLYKSGRMAVSEAPAACNLRISAEAQGARVAAVDSPVPAARGWCFPQELAPPAIPHIVHARHLRAPPAVA